MSIIGDNIKKFRKLKNLSQEELSLKILDEKGTAISRASIARYESGKDPSFDMLNKIAKVLDVSVFDLTGDASVVDRENAMIELLIENTQKGIMKWHSYKSELITFENSEMTHLKTIQNILNKKSLKLSDLKNDVYISIHNNVEYLLLSNTSSELKLLVDAHEHDLIFDFHNKLDESLSKLVSIIEASILSDYYQGLDRIIESLNN